MKLCLVRSNSNKNKFLGSNIDSLYSMKLNSIIRRFVFKHSRGSVNGLCRTECENLIMHELRIIEITIRCCKETFFIIPG